MKRSQKFLLFALSMCISLSLQSQAWTTNGNGTYKFNSFQPYANLSFYMFGDGYHSFAHKSKHDYLNSGMVPVHYTVGPYDAENVEEFVMPTTGEGTTTPTITQVEMDNKVSIKRSWNLVEDKKNFFILMFENNESTTISGCIEFHFNDSKTNVFGGQILDHEIDNSWVYGKNLTSSLYLGYTHKYEWSFDDLEPNEQRFIYIPAECLGEVFQNINTRAVMKVEDPTTSAIECDTFIGFNKAGDGSVEGNIDSDIYTLSSIVSSNPHDPNCIEVRPYRGVACDAEQLMRYKVTFQNEGETPAQHVSVELDITHEYQNVELITATDNCDLSWDQNGITARFQNIFLPGMAEPHAPHDYWETVGSFEIDVCMNLYDLQATSLDAKAVITFDSEEPIPVYSEVPVSPCYGTPPVGYNLSDLYNDWTQVYVPECPVSPAQQQYYPNGLGTLNDSDVLHRSNKYQKLDNVNISPNPVMNRLYLSGLDVDIEANIEIFSITGELVKSLSSSSLEVSNSIDVSNFSKGIYILNIESNGSNQVVRFVKQ